MQGLSVDLRAQVTTATPASPDESRQASSVSQTRHDANASSTPLSRVLPLEGLSIRRTTDVSASHPLHADSSREDAGTRPAETPSPEEQAQSTSVILSLFSDPQAVIQAFSSQCEKVMPFLILLAMVFVVQHLTGFFQLAVVICSVSGLNLHMAALTNTREGQIYKVMDTLLIVLLNISAVLVMGQPDAHMWRVMTLRPPTTNFSTLQCFFYASVGPLMLKQWMALVKVLTVLGCHFVKFPGTRSVATRQAGALTFVEYVSLAWTEAMPIPIWFGYLQTLCIGTPMMSFSAGVYMALKGSVYIQHVKNLCTAVKLLLFGHPPFGQEVSQEEVLEAGNQCPICHDSLRAPLKLECGHLYCGNCIKTWLERERTCPMCRSLVKHDHLVPYDKGTTTLWPGIF